MEYNTSFLYYNYAVLITCVGIYCEGHAQCLLWLLGMVGDAAGMNL